MRKNGHCNIRQAAQDKRERYMSDLFTTFVDLDWMYRYLKNIEIMEEYKNTKLFEINIFIYFFFSIALFIGFYAIIWVIFSFLYWVVAFARGDLGNSSKSALSTIKKFSVLESAANVHG